MADRSACFLSQAQQIASLVEAFCIECEKNVMYVRAARSYVTRDHTLLSFQKGEVIKLTNKDMLLDRGEETINKYFLLLSIFFSLSVRVCLSVCLTEVLKRAVSKYFYAVNSCCNTCSGEFIET